MGTWKGQASACTMSEQEGNEEALKGQNYSEYRKPSAESPGVSPETVIQ